MFIQNITLCFNMQKFGVSIFLYIFKEINTFIHEGSVKWIKGDNKDLYCEKIFRF